MKKLDITKYKTDFIQKLAFDFKQWMSPAVRDYYALFLKNAQYKRAHLLSWVKEYSVLENGRSVKVAQKPIQVSSEARVHKNRFRFHRKRVNCIYAFSQE